MDKVLEPNRSFQPIEIPDQEIGSKEIPELNKSQPSKTFVPNRGVERKFPSPPNVAKQVISTSLDTASKKIRAIYQFAKMGAIKIGEYINGISGEIVISPDGISAKNVNGEDTLVIDGTTGNITIKGTLAAGSTIATTMAANNITAGSFVDNIDIGTGFRGYIRLDGPNGRIIINDGTTNRIVIGNIVTPSPSVSPSASLSPSASASPSSSASRSASPSVSPSSSVSPST